MTLTEAEVRLLAELPFLRKVYPRAPRTLEGLALESRIRAFAASREHAVAGMTLREASTRRR